jgi:acetate kinase
MNEYAVVLNAGSSSLKFCVFRRRNPDAWLVDTRGQIEGIGTSPQLSARDSHGAIVTLSTLDPSVFDGRTAIDTLASWLRSKYAPGHIVGVGHRVVHGGSQYSRPVLITREVLVELYELIPLAPMHQPYNLMAVERIRERMPEVPQVACFDTSFHQTQSQVAKLIPLPKNIRKFGVQRYGFHGLSYEFIASVLPDTAPEIAGGRVIVAHLGSGASMCALKNRISVDCTLGFTALDGLCMGTRAGALDPGVVLYLYQGLGLSAKDIETMLYKKSGLLGISGVTPDMRELLAADEPEAHLAIDYFVYRAAKEIGSLAAVLGGVDGLVFTGGIGENSPAIRKRICEASSWLGVVLDSEANSKNVPRISTHASEVSTWVIPTNEELMIARHTGALLGLLQAVA